jgi:diadenosine tetraphosphate (Ap4A) HIT family hydrolase
MAACRTCELVQRRDAGDAPPWDLIVRTPTWDIVHAFGTSVEGWLVLVLRRHLTALADLSEAEAAELGPLIRSTSIALREVVACEKTYVVQFAEHEQHPHVHVHVIARMPDQPDDAQGPRIFSRAGVADEDAVPEARMNEIALAVRALLHVESGLLRA